MPGIIAHPIQYPFFRNLLVPIQTAPLENTRNDLAVEALLSLRQQSSIVGQVVYPITIIILNSKPF